MLSRPGAARAAGLHDMPLVTVRACAQALARLPALEDEAAAVLHNNSFALSMATQQAPTRKQLGELRKRAESAILAVCPALHVACNGH